MDGCSGGRQAGFSVTFTKNITQGELSLGPADYRLAGRAPAGTDRQGGGEWLHTWGVI